MRRGIDGLAGIIQGKLKLDPCSEALFLKNELAEVKEQLEYLKKVLYGRKSEKSEVIFEGAEQIPMFNEAEEEADVNPKAPLQTTEGKAHKRVRRTRDEIMENLPVEEVFHEAENKACEKCGAEMTVIGKEKIRDELVYVPARFFLRRHMAETVKCPACGTDAEKDAQPANIGKCVIHTASVPAPMIPHSFCSPELLAHIVYEKYVNAVPLYRLEKDFAAKGANISRTTMANWIILSSQLWAKPVWERIHRELLSSRVIHADETVVQVLNEPERKPETESRMWAYCSGKENGSDLILFEYRPTRNGDNAERFLGDYSGYLICDGYDAYNKLKKAVRCGCWAHLWRKFVDALPGEKELLSSSAAAVGVEYCNRLFMLERKYNGEDEGGKQVTEPLTPEERRIRRGEESRPIIDEFYT